MPCHRLGNLLQLTLLGEVLQHLGYARLHPDDILEDQLFLFLSGAFCLATLLQVKRFSVFVDIKLLRVSLHLEVSDGHQIA